MQATHFPGRKPICIAKETLDVGLTLVPRKFCVQREQGEPEKSIISHLTLGKIGRKSRKEPGGRRAGAHAALPEAVCLLQGAACAPRHQGGTRNHPEGLPGRQAASSPCQPVHSRTSQTGAPNSPSKMREKTEARPALSTCHRPPAQSRPEHRGERNPTSNHAARFDHHTGQAH